MQERRRSTQESIFEVYGPKVVSTPFPRKNSIISKLESMKHNIVTDLITMKQTTIHRFAHQPREPFRDNQKRKGERGSPCLKPLPTLKALVGLPFTKTDIEL
jgi:hypothetical protein